MLPTVSTTSANIAGYFHARPSSSRRARIVSASNHGRPANGSSSTEIRDTKFREYGASMNSTIATGTPGPRTCNVRIRYSTPSAAATRMVPNQIRCEIQAGTPSMWNAQKNGPVGQRYPICW